MAILNTDFQLVVTGTYLGAQWNSVYHYRKTTAHAALDAANLRQAFQDDVWNVIRGMLNDGVVCTNMRAINLVDLTDYWEGAPTLTTGVIASTSRGPRFEAFSFRYNRTSRLGRNGYKRFPGVSEELVNETGLVYTGALTTTIPGTVGALGAIITNGAASFEPMIPRSQLVTLPDSTQEYVLIDLLPAGSVTYLGLTTQNSRKK